MEAWAGSYYDQLNQCMIIEPTASISAPHNLVLNEESLQIPRNVFKSADTVFILAFSTIMLNTDLHNTQIPEHKKMTQEQFIRNNRGINEKEDLPKEFLEQLYQQIKANQIQMTSDSLLLQAALTSHLPSNSNPQNGNKSVSIDFSDRTIWQRLLANVGKEQQPAEFTPSLHRLRRHRSSIHSEVRMLEERSSEQPVEEDESFQGCQLDMFVTISKSSFQSMFLLWDHLQEDMFLKRYFILLIF
jgi:Sec7-like guanine-nucleotide exchange factor